MRFAVVVFFAASLASAYTVPKRQSDVPACAETCFTTSDPTPCTNTDIPCLCLNTNFLTTVSTCAQDTCSTEDLESAAAAALARCKAAGVDLQNPLPACAVPCIQTATPASACAAEDDTCLCNDTAYIQSISTCFHSACAGDDLTTAETVGQAVCRAVGVDISSTAGAA